MPTFRFVFLLFADLLLLRLLQIRLRPTIIVNSHVEYHFLYSCRVDHVCHLVSYVIGPNQRLICSSVH